MKQITAIFHILIFIHFNEKKRLPTAFKIERNKEDVAG